MRKMPEYQESLSATIPSVLPYPMGGGVLPQFLTLHQAASFMNISPNSYKKYVDDGIFTPAIKLHGMNKYMYATTDVRQDFLKLVEMSRSNGGDSWRDA
jgi:hypothetical protein